MEHGEYVNLIDLDIIYDTIGAFNNFSNLFHFILGNRSSRKRELTDLLRPPG